MGEVLRIKADRILEFIENETENMEDDSIRSLIEEVQADLEGMLMVLDEGPVE